MRIRVEIDCFVFQNTIHKALTPQFVLLLFGTECKWCIAGILMNDFQRWRSDLLSAIRGGIVAFADDTMEGEDDEATIENDDNIPTAEDDGGEDADSSVVETERVIKIML